MSAESDLAEVNQKLGVVIALLLRLVGNQPEDLPVKQQIKLLSELGLRPRDIASILGRTQTHVNKELVRIRKDQKSRKSR